MRTTNVEHENKQVIVSALPSRAATIDLFEVRGSRVPTLTRGDVLVRAMYLSIDPWLRAAMRDRSAVPVGSVVPGDVVGRVVSSTHAAFRAGDIVQGPLGWQHYAAAPWFLLRKVEPYVTPTSAALGILGSSGLTAYVGLFVIGQIRPRDVVVISAAAGAVGSAAAQLAKATGCRVIGIAGTDEKATYLMREVGVSAAVNYRHVDWRDELGRSCPFGADVYFDNVGGRVSEAVLRVMKPKGRVIVCGQIAGYDRAMPPRALPLGVVLEKQLRVEGFLVSDHQAIFPRALHHLTMGWRAGALRVRETVSHGIERAPEAFVSMLHGGNIGKQLVEVG